MKLHLIPDPQAEETEVTVRYREMDGEVNRLIANLRVMDKKLTGIRDGETYLLEPKSILYADTVDKKTFLYGQREVYETPLRLYEIEERLSGYDFVRVSKSAIVNLGAVRSIRPEINGRLLMTLVNGEALEASRLYANNIKDMLGVK